MGDASSTPTVLVVGAGAVGQVFAAHLAAGGAKVTFFVREKYRETLREGLTLFALGRRGATRRRFESYDVVTTTREVAARRFDQVWLTVSSDALRLPWLGELLEATPKALVVAALPTETDRAHLLTLLPAERLVQGIVTFLAYPSPLEGEPRDEPGMAYWFPPLVACGFAGTDLEAARGVVKLLDRGGCPARVQRDLLAEASFASALLMPALAVLEGVGFSFAAFRADRDRVALAARASEEAFAVVASRLGRPAPLLMRAVGRGFLYRLATGWGPRVAPFDLETYWRFHFTKVGAQTRLVMREYRDAAIEAGLPHEALDRCLDELARLDGEPSSPSGASLRA